MQEIFSRRSYFDRCGRGRRRFAEFTVLKGRVKAQPEVVPPHIPQEMFVLREFPSLQSICRRFLLQRISCFYITDMYLLITLQKDLIKNTLFLFNNYLLSYEQEVQKIDARRARGLPTQALNINLLLKENETYHYKGAQYHQKTTGI